MNQAPKINFIPKIRLSVGRGPHAGMTVEFERESIFLGRASENDVVLSEDVKVSRKHAEIKLTDLGFEILNLSDKNNVYVGGEVRQRWLLKSGEHIVLGQSDIEFCILGELQDASDLTISPPKSATGSAPISALKTKTAPLDKTAPQLPPSIALAPEPAPFSLPQDPAMSYPPAPSQWNTPNQPLANSWQQAPPGVPPQGPWSQTANASQRPPLGSKPDSTNMIRLGLVVVVAALFLGWYFSGAGGRGGAKKESTDLYRTFEKIQQDIQRSEENLTAYKEKKEKMDSAQYRRAQEHLVKGLRDYQQGQYARARDSFQLVLNLDSENEIARRYYQLSRIKFDERVKFHIRQGMSYRERNNFRLCRSSYANAMKMINNPTDPIYKEAEQFFRECDLALMGRF